MPRFQFSLRALLVTTAVLAGAMAWLTYNAKIVQERKAAWPFLDAGMRGWPACTRPDIPRQSGADVSWIRRMMGDRPMVTLVYYPDKDDVDRSGLARIERVFPEAEIWCFDGAKRAAPEGMKRLSER